MSQLSASSVTSPVNVRLVSSCSQLNSQVGRSGECRIGVIDNRNNLVMSSSVQTIVSQGPGTSYYDSARVGIINRVGISSIKSNVAVVSFVGYITC